MVTSIPLALLVASVISTKKNAVHTCFLPSLNYNGPSSDCYPLTSMLRKLSRRVRSERLLRAFLKAQKAHAKRARQRILREKRNIRRDGLHHAAHESSSESLSGFDSQSSASVASLSLSTGSDSDSDSDTLSTASSEDSLGSQSTSSSQTSEDFEEAIALMEVDEALEDMPDLVDFDFKLFDDDDEDEEEIDDDEDELGNEADDEEVWIDEELQSSFGPGYAKWVRKAIEQMYSTRYEEPRDEPVPRPPAQMPHTLEVLKDERPDLFREILRVTPYTFDKILEKIENDPVFFNNSHNPQIPIEEQLAITLYRFGHDGNAASQASVGRWAGTGKGSPALHTKRVMTAILRQSFMSEAVRLPTLEEKSEAKAWVEAHSCKAWRNGWIFVDGTLIPLFDRPNWYGESYFDRKCNYSLNVQVFYFILSSLKSVLIF